MDVLFVTKLRVVLRTFTTARPESSAIYQQLTTIHAGNPLQRLLLSRQENPQTSMSKADAARANGGKSKGPTTEQGKARSAQNSLKHGLNSNTVVLRTESQEEYDQLLFDYIRLYQPVGPIEQDLVHEIAATRWRLRRILRMEAAAFDNAIERAAEENPDTAESVAFEDLAENSKALRMLNRYEGRLRRAYERAATELRHIQAARVAAEQPFMPEPAVQNEPITHRSAYEKAILLTRQTQAEQKGMAAGIDPVHRN